MRFSIRDLLLVTVIVALMLGWWVREQQIARELERAKRWRIAAGTLEKLLNLDGFEVRWQFDLQPPGVEVRRDDRGHWHSMNPSNEPSEDQLPLGGRVLTRWVRPASAPNPFKE